MSETKEERLRRFAQEERVRREKEDREREELSRQIRGQIYSSKHFHALTRVDLNLTDEEREYVSWYVDQETWRMCNELYLTEEAGSPLAHQMKEQCVRHLAEAATLMTAVYQSEGPWVEAGGLEHSLVRSLWEVSGRANLN